MRKRMHVQAEQGSAPMDSPAGRTLQYRAAFLDGISPERVRAIGEALLEKAEAGEVAAAKLVLDYVLGATPVDKWDSAADVTRRSMFNGL